MKNSKGIYEDIGQKRKAKKNVPLGKRKLASTDMEKAEVLSELFVLVFAGTQDSYISHGPGSCIPKPLGGGWRSKSPPL